MSNGMSDAEKRFKQERVTEILIDIARNNEDPIIYSKLAEKIGLHHRSPKMSEILEEVSNSEYNEGRGLLTALVVRKNIGLPSAAFFHLARSYGETFSDERVFWEDAVEKVRNIWSS